MRTAITLSRLALLALPACSGTTVVDDSTERPGEVVPPTADEVTSDEVAEPSEREQEVAAPAEEIEEVERFARITTPLFDESPDTVEISKTTWALATPFADGERLGLVRGNTPIGIQSHVVNDECETPWIEVQPRGFVCMDAAPARARKTSKRKKKKSRAMIGSYAIAAKGATFYKSIKAAEEGKKGRKARGDMLRLGKSVTLEDGRTFRKTDRGEYIATSDVRRLWGSKFAGVELPATFSGPIAFAVNSRRVKAKVTVRREPSTKARKAKKLKARSLVTILEISEDKMFARIGDDRWVERVDLREIEIKEPPAEVSASSNSRWADIDLDKQLVVIYEGTRPIYATLASTGREKDRTPTSVFRVTRKKKMTTMRSDRSRRQTYSAAVPWSTYFHEGIAFHTAYWHNSFGKARSHGCVNLAPKDAKRVYELLGPEVPQGWSVVYGHESQLGSVVQVRSIRPNPVPPKDEEGAAVASN